MRPGVEGATRNAKYRVARHQRWQIRQPALLSKLLSSAKGLLRMLSATAAKSISEVKPSNKRGAHQQQGHIRMLLDA